MYSDSSTLTLRFKQQPDRAMITAHDIGANESILNGRDKPCADKKVVYAPAGVPLTRFEHIAPPCVGIRPVGIKHTETVRKAAFKQNCEFLSFFIGESCIAAVALRVFKVNFVMRNVHIAADDNGFFLIKSDEIGTESILPFAAEIKPCKLALRIRGVYRYKIIIGKFKGYDASLGFEFFIRTHAVSNGKRFFFCEDGRSGITFFFGIIPEAHVPFGGEIYLPFLQFCFLKSKNVGIGFVKKVFETFAHAGAQPVNVP